MASRKKTTKKSDAVKETKAKAAIANAVKETADKTAEAAKKAEPAAAEKSAPAGDAVAAKEEPKKAEPAKKDAPEKKAASEKAPAKKAPAKKAEPAMTIAHVFEIDGDQINTDDVAQRIQDAYKADGHQIGRIKKIDVYYNFAERKAYYVINDNPEGKFVEF